MKKEINTLFSLIRCAVLGEKMSESEKEEAERETELLYKMARHHDMAHLLDYACKISGVCVSDEKTAFELIKQNAMSVMRYENLNLALVNISSLFEKKKIQFIPLKGAVIRQLYPEPWMRTSCDIDILVHEADLDRAEKALVEELSFTSKGEKGYHDISLYSDTGVHLELHYNVKENMENADGILEEVWDYASPKEEGSFEYVLKNEFLYFQHIAHMAYHVSFGGCSIRYFLDLFLLENRLTVDNDVLGKMLEESRLGKFREVSLKLSRIWFSDEKHDEITAIYQKYLLNGGIYGTKMNQIAANSNKKSTLSYAFSRIFMPYEKLCITYPFLRGKKLLLPFYQVRRWMRIVKRRRYKYASEEFKANSGVSSNSINEFSGLVESLELNKS